MPSINASTEVRLLYVDNIAIPIDGSYITTTVGPTFASEVLEKYNYKNFRKMKPNKVAQYANDMNNGLWGHSPAAITFSWDDSGPFLSDGQHRLAAVAQSGHTIPVVICGNFPVKDIVNIDTGIPRQWWQYHLEIGPKGQAAIKGYLDITKALSIGASNLQSPNHSFALLEETAQKHPRLIELVGSTNKMRHQGQFATIPDGAIDALRYILEGLDESECDDFFYLIGTGDGTPVNHPCWSMRAVLHSPNLCPESSGHGRGNHVKIFIRAWNCYRLKKKISQYKLRDAIKEGLVHPE